MSSACSTHVRHSHKECPLLSYDTFIGNIGQPDLRRARIERVSSGLARRLPGVFERGCDISQVVKFMSGRKSSWVSLLWGWGTYPFANCSTSKSDTDWIRIGQTQLGIVYSTSGLGAKAKGQKRLIAMCSHRIESKSSNTKSSLIITYVQDVTVLHAVSRFGLRILERTDHLLNSSDEWWHSRPKYLTLALSQFGLVDLVYPYAQARADARYAQQFKKGGTYMNSLVAERSLFELVHPDDVGRVIAALRLIVDMANELDVDPCELDRLKAMSISLHNHQRRNRSRIVKLTVQMSTERPMNWNDNDLVFSCSRFVELSLCCYEPSSFSSSPRIKALAGEEECQQPPNPKVILATLHRIDGSQSWHSI